MDKFIDIPCVKDVRGSVSFVESLKHIPFEIKRVYWLHDNELDAVRGEHAHKNLEQVLICIAGSIELELDDGKTKTTMMLDSSSKGVYIGNLVWRTMRKFDKHTIILVLASEYYLEDDYYRNYKDFLNACAVS